MLSYFEMTCFISFLEILNKLMNVIIQIVSLNGCFTKIYFIESFQFIVFWIKSFQAYRFTVFMYLLLFNRFNFQNLEWKIVFSNIRKLRTKVVTKNKLTFFYCSLIPKYQTLRNLWKTSFYSSKHIVFTKTHKILRIPYCDRSNVHF